MSADILNSMVVLVTKGCLYSRTFKKILKSCFCMSVLLGLFAHVR